MSLIRRYLTGFRGVDTDAPGLFEKDDGTSWYRKPDGSEIEIGNGGARPANWCLVQIDGGPGDGVNPPLTVGHDQFVYQETALTITDQSGTDFTVVPPDVTHSGGMIVSAAGGMFQAGMIVPQVRSTSGLDPGSTDARWVQIGFVMGDTIPSLEQIGYDCSFQIGAKGQQTFAGLPGISTPGGPTVADIEWRFENPFGTDSLNLEIWDFPCLVIWQIG